MEISKKMLGTITEKWGNSNIVWESNPDMAIVQIGCSNYKRIGCCKNP